MDKTGKANVFNIVKAPPGGGGSEKKKGKKKEKVRVLKTRDCLCAQDGILTKVMGFISYLISSFACGAQYHRNMSFYL